MLCLLSIAGAKLLPVFAPSISLSGAIMNNTKTLLFAGLAAAAMFAGQAYATPVLGGTAPPGWVINLNGQPNIRNPARYVQYTADFVATKTTTHITFALRNDTFETFYLDNIAVSDINSSSVNLVLNGGFEGGTAPSGGNASAPMNWQYLDPYGAFLGSTLDCGGSPGQGGSSCAWSGGAERAYDLITQPIATAIGDEYQISFWAQGPDEGAYWNEFPSSVDQEGIAFNIAAYVGSIPPRPVPEPAALGMFGMGVLLTGALVTLRRRGGRANAS